MIQLVSSGAMSVLIDASVSSVADLQLQGLVSRGSGSLSPCLIVSNLLTLDKIVVFHTKQSRKKILLQMVLQNNKTLPTQVRGSHRVVGEIKKTLEIWETESVRVACFYSDILTTYQTCYLF